MTVVDVVTAVLLLTGALSCLLGALGLVRFPDVPSRLQAATKPQTLGLLLILVGTAIRLEFESAATLLLVVLFQIFTAPVISQIVGRSAYRAGTLRSDELVVDELADPMARDDLRAAGTPVADVAVADVAVADVAVADVPVADVPADDVPGPAPRPDGEGPS